MLPALHSGSLSASLVAKAVLLVIVLLLAAAAAYADPAPVSGFAFLTISTRALIASSARRFGEKGKEKMERGVKSSVYGSSARQSGHSSESCQYPHPRCTAAKHHFKTQSAQYEWPQHPGVRLYGHALMGKMGC